MTTEPPIKIEVAQDSVRQVIAAHVQTAVMEALLPHKEQFVRELVEQSLLKKSSDQKYRHERDDRKPTELEHIVRTIIAEEARKGIQAWAESHREEIAENIRRMMATKKWGRGIATQIVEQMITTQEYHFKLEVLPVIRRD